MRSSALVTAFLSTVGGVLQCSHGYFRTGAVCTACPAGKFRRVVPPWDESYREDGACDECMPGTSQPSQGGTSCVPCAPGQFGTEFAQPTCSACALGKWSVATRAEACLSCAAGRYGDAPNHCTACPEGRSTAMGDALDHCELLTCPMGKFAEASKQFSATAINLCYNCPAGQHGTTDGTSFTEAGMSASCADCATGKYQPLYGRSQCLACPSGRHQHAAGATHCAVDVPHVQLNSVACPGGKYAEDTTFTPVDGQEVRTNRVCYDCPRGKFSPRGETAMACTQCAQGTFEAGEGSLECLSCPAGKHQGKRGRSYCDHDTVGEPAQQKTPCARGFYVSPRSPTWLDPTASPICLPCSPGRYGVRVPAVTDDKEAACAVCALGQFTPDHASTSCIECASGTFGVKIMGVSSCEACPEGRFQHQRGSTRCFEPRQCSHTRCRFVHKNFAYTLGTGAGDVKRQYSVAMPLAAPSPHAVIVFSHSDEAHGDQHRCSHDRDAMGRSRTNDIVHMQCHCMCW